MNTSVSAESERVGPALGWIIGQIESRDLPYQVVGGLAARAWGGAREVVDIDIYLPFDVAHHLLASVSEHIVWGPERYLSENWDLTFLKIDFGEQRIELGDSSSSPRYFNVADGRWEEQRIDFESSDRATLFGVDFDVIARDELILYKRHLDREVDRLDVADLTRSQT